jgi:hypothetical protein|tara:strand:+ start:289 stop:552 length:264 start_codon:yes stop_codon:yes gene_type:complete
MKGYNMTTKNTKYFVIEKTKYSYPNEHFKYDIMKNIAFDLSTAFKKLVAYEELNDNKDKTYHVQNIDLSASADEQPLLLTKDMEVKQ